MLYKYSVGYVYPQHYGVLRSTCKRVLASGETARAAQVLSPIGARKGRSTDVTSGSAHSTAQLREGAAGRRDAKKTED